MCALLYKYNHHEIRKHPIVIYKLGLVLHNINISLTAIKK